MQNIYLIVFFLFVSLIVKAQDYKIDFTASGATTTLDSVHVKNLDQQTELTLGGSDTLHLYKSGSGIDQKSQRNSRIRVAPNPIHHGIGTILFFADHTANAKIELYDMEGKRIFAKELFFQMGENEILLRGLPSGFFLLNVKTKKFAESVKLISINGKQGAPSLEQLSWRKQLASKNSIKAIKTLVGMSYNDGEALKMTGYADSLVSVDTLIPTQSQTVDFHFEPFGSYPSGTVHCISGGAVVVDVTNPATGKTWMDRNLGASRQATSSTDSQSYGDLYQWGRFSDGHQCRGSDTRSATSATDNPAHGDFITSNSDWRSPQNDNLWQGVYGINNPCPNGYRLPTQTELNNEHLSWLSDDAAGAYSSALKLPVAGYRYRLNGFLSSVSSIGFYWSSSIDGIRVRRLYVSSSDAIMFSYYRAAGGSVRCIKD